MDEYILPIIKLSSCLPFGRNRVPLEYEPLPTPTSIRLLETESSRNFDETIICSLVVKDLNDFEEYDSLSYTWGNPLSETTSREGAVQTSEDWSAGVLAIECDNKCVLVTTNLYSALLTLRHYRTEDSTLVKMSRYIWIDQICINQADDTEKNGQVQLMSRIYRQAKTVQIWLGGHDRDFSAFSKVMNSLEPIDFREWNAYTSFDVLQKHSYDEQELPYITPDTWFQTLESLCRSWFHRSWIIQEVAFASQARAFCGLSTINFGSLVAFGNFLEKSGWFNQIIKDPRIGDLKPQIHPLLFSALLAVKYHLGIGNFDKYEEAGWKEPLSLLEILRIFRPSQATNARDKIYAFINLSKESLGSLPYELVPRYEHSTAEIYIRAVTCMLRTGKWSLDLFSLREDESLRLIKSLPSWVPDFSVPNGHNSLITVHLAKWAAGTEIDGRMLRILPGPALELIGSRVDTISHIQSFRAAGFRTGDHLQHHSSTLIDIPSFGDLIQMLQQLPESSITAALPNAQKFRHGVRGRDGNEMINHSSITEAFTEPSADICRADQRHQSRQEVLWRTLIHNHLGDCYPAPDYCGEIILQDMEDAFYVKVAGCLNHELQRQYYARSGCISWADLVKRVAKDYTVIQALKNRYLRIPDPPMCPPEFAWVMYQLVRQWNSFAYIEDVARVRRYCEMVQAKADQLFAHNDQKAIVRNRMLGSSRGRLLFITTQNYVGSGLLSTQPGDEVWVLSGSSVPCVLRRVQNGRYKLVGEAYVHGVMHGEALELPQAKILLE